jgi:hypothetical protein
MQRVAGGPNPSADAPAKTAAMSAEARQLQEDTDALHILPLGIIPLRTPGLARARLIKNSLLEGVVELFHDRHSGSGQCHPDDLPSRFRFDHKDDIDIVRKLAGLASYDVYSLRGELRRLGIAVDSHARLRLSEAKRAALMPYLGSYVRPLIVRIYGDAGNDVGDLESILRLFWSPDAEVALRNLRDLASRLEVLLEEVPRLLETYGDVYLSLSYYQSCLDETRPVIDNLLTAMGDLRRNSQTRSEASLQDACRFVERRLQSMIADMTGLTEMFVRQTEDMWDDVTPASFRAMKDTIEGYQTTIGGNLCIATVKMRAWSKHFPTGTGAPTKKASIIMSEVRPGLERIRPLQYADVGRPQRANRPAPAAPASEVEYI